LRKADDKQAAQDLADNQRFPEALKHQQALPAFLRLIYHASPGEEHCQ
jgi:hypothetical protein